MSIDQIRAIWNVSEVVIEELVTSAEGLKGASDADKRAFVKEKAGEAIGVLISHQSIVSGTTATLAQKGLEYVLDLVIDRVWASVIAKSATAAAA